MNVTDLIDALGLPANARMNQRIPKKLLMENGAPTTGDMRQINEGIKDLHWVATLKPTTIGVAEYRDGAREILEVVVLCLTLHVDAKSKRLAELVHRAVPYPIILIIEQGPSLTLSLAQKRWSQGETGRTVLDGEIIETRLDDEFDDNIPPDFWETLTLAKQPRSTLYALYQGWIDTILALKAFRITGIFAMLNSGEHTAARHAALLICSALELEMANLRAASVKEKQIPRQVELNLTLKRLEAEYANARARL